MDALTKMRELIQVNRRFIVPVLALVVVCGPPLALGAGPDPSAEEEAPTVLTYLEWKSAKFKTMARGLRVDWHGPDESVTRTIVETPKGNHTVLTSKSDWKRGEFSYKLLEEETGWWAELVTRTSFRNLNPDNYEELIRDLQKLQTGEEWGEESFLTCDGFFWQAMASPDRKETLDPALPAAFAASEQASRISPGAAEGASFLLAFSNHRELGLGSGQEALLVTVLKAAGVGDQYSTRPWLVESPLGLRFIEPDTEIDPLIADLLTGFPTVDADNPREDRR